MPVPRPSRAAATETGLDLGRRIAVGTLLAGRYRIESVLGLGGMGVVYRARDEEIGEPVALKVLRPDLAADPRLLDRFRQELVLGRQVSHRNVVRIHDIGEADGLRFLTMRFVEGRSLLSLLDEGPLPLERAVRIVRQVADALHHAHEAGVVHRDLKPANILVDAQDNAFVTDFGVARSLSGGGLTAVGAVVGTPDYLSPEQVAGDPVDGRSDLYALGIVFFEALTGEMPFRGDTHAELLAQRLGGRPRDLAETGVRVPAWVQRVVRKCMERLPSRRYQTGAEVIADLDRAQATRRPRPPTLALATALVALAAGGGWWASRRADPAAGTATTTAPAPAAPRHRVALLPFLDQTSDPTLAWTGTGVPEMVASALAASPDLRVSDPQRVARMLVDLQVQAGTHDDATLRRLAELLDVDRLVVGTVRRAGEAFRVEARLLDAQGGAFLAPPFTSDASNATALFGAVRRLGDQLGQALGSAPRARPAPETASVEAVRAYQEGLAKLAAGDTLGAAPLFERAVEADPRFAAAHERLSGAYQAMGRHDRAVAAAEKAAGVVDPANVRLAQRVRARRALLAGRPADAAQAYADLVARYPNDVEALLDLAAAQSAQGEVARAVQTLERATAVDRSDPRVWYLLGRNAILAGDAPRAASDHLVRALALFTRLGNRQGQADVQNALGVAHHEMGELPQAIEKYSAAADLRGALGDRRGQATSLKNRARAAVALGRFAEAEPDLEKARALYAELGDQVGRADVLNEMGLLHEGRGDYRMAREAYAEALRLRRDLGDERQIAQSYDNVGYIYFLEGEYENALVYWRQALDVRRRVGDRTGVVLSLQNMGFLATAQGRWGEAMRFFVEALEKGREVDFRPAAAVSHGNIGLIHLYEGRYAAALDSYAKALRDLKASGDARGQAEFTLREAGALLELGRVDDARDRLREAEAHVKATGNREHAADHAALLAEWHLLRGEKSEARAAAERAVSLARESHGRAVLLRARLQRAAVLAPAAGVAELVEVARDADRLGDPLLRIRAAESLARAELERRRFAPAADAARRGIAIAESIGWRAGLHRLYALLALAAEGQGDETGSAAAWKAAGNALETLRGQVPEALRASFDALPLSRHVRARVGTPAAPPGAPGAL